MLTSEVTDSPTPSLPSPVVRPREYVVTCLPDGDPAAWDVHVEYHGRGQWAVRHRIYTLNADGTWDVAQQSRDDERFLATHLFPREEALGRAKQAAPDVRVHGRTLVEFLAQRPSQQANAGGGAPC